MSPTVAKPAPKAAPAPAAPRSLAGKAASNNASNQAIEDLSNQLMDMRLNLEGLEKERDFYFSKLRDIEILCQEADESESSAIITKILDILYATEVSVGGLTFKLTMPNNKLFFRMVSLHPMNWHRKRKSIKLISEISFKIYHPLNNNNNHFEHES